MFTEIPVIDLFAGPGGLGEGFSSVFNKSGKPVYKILLSIEKEKHAHSTLLLRTFFRQFSRNEIPLSYYEYIRGEISREEMFAEFPKQVEKALDAAWLIELGQENNKLIDSRIYSKIRNRKNWVLIGGPPCQAYSLAGRSRIRGENEEKYQNDPRHYLYKEYLRILAVHQPSVFVMENVKGLLSAKVKGNSTFNLILTDLKKPLCQINKTTGQPLEYYLFPLSKPSQPNLNDFTSRDFIVKSELFGIPQARHRIFIMGIRKDYFKEKPQLLSFDHPITVGDVLDDLPKLRSKLSKEPDTAENWFNVINNIKKSNWITQIPEELRNEIINEIENIDISFSSGNYYIPGDNKPLKLSDWFCDNRVGGFCNHETRGHIRQDLHRYFYAGVYAKLKGRSPIIKDFPRDLLPAHKNIEEAVNLGKFSDRFRVQLRNKPATTIVSHISKDGHYYIHYDPSQCRSFTVREAARIQTFPDNYFFEGSKTHQYHQVGNAVPPLLAKKIAQIVLYVFENA